jgi:hypothetical protein
MFRLSHWLILAVFALASCLYVAAESPISDANTTCNFDLYTMFIIPEEKSWTLVISKSTDISGKYDEAHDLARIPMQFGKLLQAEPEFSAYFAHVAPGQCNLRLDAEKARAWIDFERK